jgi:ParB family chromosome partitioning protein
LTTKRPALGRGLNALIPKAASKPTSSDGEPADATASPRGAKVAPPSAPTQRLPIEKLEPNPEQPRRHFDEAAIKGLAQSIATVGIIQPIVVHKEGVDRYLILAGERRWRAAQRAGLHEVPVVVRDTPGHHRLELALVENLQRADLNAIEEATAYQQLMDLNDWTQEELASRVGKDRSSVANAVRLLRLPPPVRDMVVHGVLGMGHARALLSLQEDAQMISVAKSVVGDKLSVRATEAKVRGLLRPSTPPLSDEAKRSAIIVKDLEERLTRALGIRAKLRVSKRSKNRGVIELPYAELDELTRLLTRIIDGPGS